MPLSTPPAIHRIFRKVVLRARSDEDFRNRFVAAPLDVLREYGMVLPEGVTPEMALSDVSRLQVVSEQPEPLEL